MARARRAFSSASLFRIARRQLASSGIARGPTGWTIALIVVAATGALWRRLSHANRRRSASAPVGPEAGGPPLRGGLEGLPRKPVAAAPANAASQRPRASAKPGGFQIDR